MTYTLPSALHVVSMSGGCYLLSQEMKVRSIFQGSPSLGTLSKGRVDFGPVCQLHRTEVLRSLWHLLTPTLATSCGTVELEESFMVEMTFSEGLLALMHAQA